MRHASLFTGIGAADLAAEWTGWNNVFQVENDKKCIAVLYKQFPHIPKHNDVRDFDATEYKHRVDVLSGGDPCQPHSVAGLRKGTADVRFLWPEMFRIAQELNVPYLVNENVSGSVSNGVLDLKINDLESVGYACQAYSIPAEAVGALHQRSRIWLVAHNPHFNRDCKITRGLCLDQESQRRQVEIKQHQIHQFREPTNIRPVGSYTNLERRKELYYASFPDHSKERLSRYFGFGSAPHGNIPRNVIESGIMGMLNGLPEELYKYQVLIDDYKTGNPKTISKTCEFAEQVLRNMREQQENSETSSGLFERNNKNSMSNLPPERTYEGWLLGSWFKKDKELRSLWERIYTEPLEKTQLLQQRVLECIREDKRRETLGKIKIDYTDRNERIKACGNAIVPQVIREIFNAIDHEEQT